MTRPPRLRPVPTWLAAVLLAGCTSSPDPASPTPAPSGTRPDDGGRDAREVEAQLGVMQDAAQEDALRALAARLEAKLPAPGERDKGAEGSAPVTSAAPLPPLTVRVLDDAVPNVFSLPGRRIYLTRGLLAWLETDDATALIVAHSLGHQAHRAQRLTRDERWSAGLGPAEALLESFSRAVDLPGRALSRLARGFEVADEREADELAAEAVARAGYDPVAGLTLLDRLDALGGGEALPTWPSTHPAPSRPTAELLARARRAQAESGASAPDEASAARAREVTLRRLEGLPFGPDPRRGYLEEGWLVHPRGRFRLPAPGRWRLRATTTQAQLSAPDGDAVLIVDTALEATDAGAAADEFGELSAVDVDVDRELEVNGLRAVRLVSRVDAPDGELVVLSTFVELRGRVVALHGVAPRRAWEDRRPQLITMHDRFEACEDPRRLEVHPAALHVIEVSRDQTLREALAAWPIPERVELDLDGLARLNGLALESVVPAGTLLRVVRRGGP